MTTKRGRQGLTIDLEYYLVNQLKNPAVSILEPVLQDPEVLFEEAERQLKVSSNSFAMDTVDRLIVSGKWQARTSGNRLLTSFFFKSAKSSETK